MKGFARAMIMAIVLGAGLSACHENLDERTERECKEYTEKYCPAPVDANVISDSMTFDRGSKTICYYYSLRGEVAQRCDERPYPDTLQGGKV